MANLSVNIVGLSNALAKTAEAALAVQHAAVEAAYAEADVILGKSLKLVPFQTGALFDTGRLEEVENEVGQITAAIAYGDANVDYALAVHEDLEAYHAPPTQAKYVEAPLREEMSSGRSVERMRAVMAGTLQTYFAGAARKFVKTGKPSL